MDLSQLPDLRAGVEIRDMSDGAIVAGRVGSDEAILVRRGGRILAVASISRNLKSLEAERELKQPTVST